MTKFTMLALVLWTQTAAASDLAPWSSKLAADATLLAQAASSPAATPMAAVSADAPARWAVMIDPLAIAVGAAVGIVNASVRIQYAFNDRFGINFAPVIAYYAPSGVSVYGGGAELGLHVSLSNSKLSRWFLRPFVSVAYATGSSSSGAEATLGGFSTGLEAGYSWTWAPGFILNLAGGVQYFTYFGGVSGSVKLDYPVLPKLSLSMGYCW